VNTLPSPKKEGFLLMLENKGNIFVDKQSEYTYYSPVPSNRAYSMLRFRTKKQKAAFTRIAREQNFSLNEYILRVLEDKHNPPQLDEQGRPAQNTPPGAMPGFNS
jgi:hypothetical protein